MNFTTLKVKTSVLQRTLKTVQREDSGCEQCVTGSGLISKINKELLQINEKNNPKEKMTYNM